MFSVRVSFRVLYKNIISSYISSTIFIKTIKVNDKFPLQVCACMHLYLHAYFINLSVFWCLHACVDVLAILVYVFVCICMLVLLFLHACTVCECLCACISMLTNVHMSAYMHACMYILSICVCLGVCMLVCMYCCFCMLECVCKCTCPLYMHVLASVCMCTWVLVCMY